MVDPGRHALTVRPLAVALLSAGSLLLEIALTRLFAVLYYPPAVFAILSLAVLGIGFGAALATWKQRLRNPALAGTHIALTALATLILLLWATVVPVIAGQIPLFALVVLPYLGVGLALATLFSNAAAASPRLYRADLLGAALGTVLAIPLLNLAGGPNAVLLAALLLSLAAILAGPRPGRPLLPALATLLTLTLLATNLARNWIEPDMSALPAGKPIAESLQQGKVVRTVWDAFARTDLVDPGDGSPYRVYVDGAAASVMPPAGDDQSLWRDIGFFPFATAEPERVFVVGPGGGLDVWFGRQSGAAEIVAVEVNGASVELVEAFAPYNGALYQDPAVRVLVDEGRSVLRRQAQPYDLIFLSQVVTLAAERSGYALVENSTVTVEAFSDYLDHLTPTGQLALKLYDEPTLTRALATALAALRQRGLSDAEALNQIIVLLDRNAETPVPLLLVRNQPFNREEALSLGAIAREIGFSPLFLPGLVAQPPLDAVAAGEMAFADVIAAATIDISPTTDDRPFFYQFERGIPPSLRSLLLTLSALVAVGALLILWRGRNSRPASVRWSPLYFAALGIGFMAIEVAVIQQTRLFLGHPTLAITVVLATLFVGGGLGSGLAGRLKTPFPPVIPLWPTAAVALLALLWITVWPFLGNAFLGARQLVRVVVVGTTLFPLALSMGAPFPLALRAVGHAGPHHVALAWAINGVMTVVGSVLAVTTAILAGFTAVLLLGTAAYTAATILARLVQPATETKWSTSQTVL